MATHERSHCPHDPVPLRHDRTDAIDAWRCERCDGLWLPAPVVARVVGDAPRWPARQATATTRLDCPDDGARLQAIHADGIELDLCPFCHGVWLDAGELARLKTRIVDAPDEADGIELLEHDDWRADRQAAPDDPLTRKRGVPTLRTFDPVRHLAAAPTPDAAARPKRAVALALPPHFPHSPQFSALMAADMLMAIHSPADRITEAVLLDTALSGLLELAFSEIGF